MRFATKSISTSVTITNILGHRGDRYSAYQVTNLSYEILQKLVTRNYFRRYSQGLPSLD